MYIFTALESIPHSILLTLGNSNTCIIYHSFYIYHYKYIYIWRRKQKLWKVKWLDQNMNLRTLSGRQASSPSSQSPIQRSFGYASSRWIFLKHTCHWSFQEPTRDTEDRQMDKQILNAYCMPGPILSNENSPHTHSPTLTLTHIHPSPPKMRGALIGEKKMKGSWKILHNLEDSAHVTLSSRLFTAILSHK